MILAEDNPHYLGSAGPQLRGHIGDPASLEEIVQTPIFSMRSLFHHKLFCATKGSDVACAARRGDALAFFFSLAGEHV